MKNKISFTSVLKNKNATRNTNSLCQYSTSSQNRTQRLIDIYQQFESNPDQDYTLELGAFRNMALRSRNSSMGMMRSRNVNEDPEMDLESWIESQKIKQNQESHYRSNYSQQGFNMALNIQNQLMLPVKKSKSGLKKPISNTEQEYYEQQTDYYQNQDINQSKGNPHMEESNKISTRHSRKGSINYKPQQQQRFLQQSDHRQDLMIQSSKRTPQQYLALEPMRQRTQFPQIEEQDYKQLQEEFDKIKAQKIAQLCTNSKKAANKQKIQQIITGAIQNIHKDIEKMAQQIVNQKKLALMNEKNTKRPSEQESDQMLISEREEQQKQDMSQSQQQMRQQKMKNMIKGYISGIQEAKSQGKSNSNFYQQKQQGTYFQQNTFNNDLHAHESSFENIPSDIVPKESNASKQSYGNNIESVGYSFSNANMICEHSFSKQVGPNCNFDVQRSETGFQKNSVQPAIYEPENQDDEVEQKISLPYIEEVRSDCGDFHHQNMGVESSEQIQFRRKKLQTLTIDISGKNIKNIQSVHYEPPSSQYKSNDLFKNFQKSHQSKQSFENSKNSFASSSLSKDNLAIQAPKFISKTFNSYLSGQKRSEYGQKVVSEQQTKNFDSSNNMKMVRPTNPPVPSINNPQTTIRISAVTKYQPANFSSTFDKTVESSTLEPTKKPSIEQIKVSCQKPIQQNHDNKLKPLTEQQINSRMNDSSGVGNESSFLSLNQSINNQNNAFNSINSSKNLHQLQSKKKFSINSPSIKVQQHQSSPYNHYQLQFKQSNITDFTNGIQNYATHKRGSSYAISSPVGQYQLNQSTKNILIPSNSYQKNGQTNYACSESIKLNPIIKNSILEMQPLKISMSNSHNFQTLPKETLTIQQAKKQSSISTSMNKYPGISKIVESHQDNDFKSNSIKEKQYPIQKTSATSPSSGRNFLQALNTKQSIQVDLSHENHILIQQSRQSFATQTFRPSLQTPTNQSISKPPALNQRSTPTSKGSITRITLKSSDKIQTNNPITSPKVISLTVNHLNSSKPSSIKPFSQPDASEQKQNIFQKLTIKESANLTQQTYEKKITLESHLASNNTMRSSIKAVQQVNTFHKPQVHVDTTSKQNTNTLNQAGKIDLMKNQSMKFDLNIDNQSAKNPMKQSMSKPTLLMEKKQPLLKLSKNLGIGTNQSISSVSGMNLKKSMGQSIKQKYCQPSASIMLGSKEGAVKSVKSSFRGVKQSIGNDSDMDFDLELD